MERWLDIALLVFVLAVIILAMVTGTMLARYCFSSSFSTTVCHMMIYMSQARS